MHQFYDMLMESQYWPREQLVDYQRSQLEQLLRHARANVPFYEHRLNPVFARDGSIDWDKWGEIPIVKRADLVDHRGAMQARQLPPGHGGTNSTSSSGSTGLPITLTVSRLATMVANVNRWRSHYWQSLDWSGVLCARRGDDPAVSSWPEGTYKGRWGPPWEPASAEGRAFEINRLAPSEQLLAFLARTATRYYATAPKPAQTLALDANRLGQSLRLEAILAHGEAVGQADRERCLSQFGARVIDLYSSKEGLQMAHPCPSGIGLHVNAESILLEILDDDGQPSALGQRGRVVITPFFSTAQPLIRYDQGDLATVGGNCRCGRSLPVLDSVDGRVTHMFRHPDGRTVAEKVPDRYRLLLGASVWQIAQTGPHAFEVRYIAEQAHGDDAAKRVTRALHETYFPDAQVNYKRLRHIPLTSAGKFIEYINEWYSGG